MGKMVKIENRRHDVVDQIKKLIYETYPPILGYTVEYYMGEDTETGAISLIFHLHSTKFGNLYRKTFQIPSGRNVYEFEPDFIGNILSDFVMLGTTLLTNQVVNKTVQIPLEHCVRDVLDKPFGKGMLKKLSAN